MFSYFSVVLESSSPLTNIMEGKDILHREMPSVIYSSDDVSIVTNGHREKDNDEVGSYMKNDDDLVIEGPTEQDTLQRTLGYRQGFVLMIGLILGSGVFLSPKLVAQVTRNNKSTKPWLSFM